MMDNEFSLQKNHLIFAYIDLKGRAIIYNKRKKKPNNNYIIVALHTGFCTSIAFLFCLNCNELLSHKCTLFNDEQYKCIWVIDEFPLAQSHNLLYHLAKIQFDKLALMLLCQ